MLYDFNKNSLERPAEPSPKECINNDVVIPFLLRQLFPS
jgi:hypothetical protein